ncbi:MAG: toprim domain-containing protein [Clostridia bacterium]|nr:toprim domain-containing protein [Clostridia bacterium]
MLKGAERVRKRPAVIFGSDGLEGCEHSVFEIVSNSVDEAREGYGSVITLTAYNDRSISVEDFGRGIPLGWNETEQRYNWELVYCELYAGGKYDNNADGAAYEYSLGLNGLGACATQYSSEYFSVKSYDGSHLTEMDFEKGDPAGELRVRDLSPKERRTGTVQHWKPDLDVFTDIAIPREYFADMLKRQSVVMPGIRFVFRWQNEDGTFEEEEYYYENGIEDYIAEIAGDTAEIKTTTWHLETKGRDREDMSDYKLKCDVSFTMSKTVHVLEYYHCSSYLEHGGSPERAVKTAFTYAIDKRLKTLGKYNKNEAKITFADVEDCLILITNSVSTQTSYANQTKKAITNTFIAEAMTAFLKEQLEIYFLENPQDADKLLTQVLINKRSRETAETARLDLKKKLTTAGADAVNRIEKFVSCRSKDPDKRELYIVEGDSALTSCKLGRDAEFQAIIPVRGKTLNCLKATYDKIFKNEIIVDLLKLLGCGVEIKGKVKGNIVPFDLNALRWSKIIICTDADEDGFQIRTLILTMFYRLLPTLIDEGRVYIAESPLYEITTKTDTLFAYNEPEKAQITSKLDAENKKYKLQRSKGLGENEPEMMWKTTMNPESRRLIRVSKADAEATAYIFETLLGDDITERKDFIFRRGIDYMDTVDAY